MGDNKEYMDSIRPERRVKRYDEDRPARKVFICRFLVGALGMSQGVIIKKFGGSGYNPQRIRKFLEENGYRKPGVGRPLKRAGAVSEKGGNFS